MLSGSLSFARSYLHVGVHIFDELHGRQRRRRRVRHLHRRHLGLLPLAARALSLLFLSASRTFFEPSAPGGENQGNRIAKWKWSRAGDLGRAFENFFSLPKKTQRVFDYFISDFEHPLFLLPPFSPSFNRALSSQNTTHSNDIDGCSTHTHNTDAHDEQRPPTSSSPHPQRFINYNPSNLSKRPRRRRQSSSLRKATPWPRCSGRAGSSSPP